MFILQLNDMRSPNAEILTPVARAETREELEAFLKRETVEPYRDNGAGAVELRNYMGVKLEDRWCKLFRKGGPLEWYNPPMCGEIHFVDVKTRDDWIIRAGQQFDDMLCEVPVVTSL